MERFLHCGLTLQEPLKNIAIIQENYLLLFEQVTKCQKEVDIDLCNSLGQFRFLQSLCNGSLSQTQIVSLYSGQ